MTSFSLNDAATLAQASYAAGRITSPQVIKSLDRNDVQAHVLEGNILLLPGSNSLRDYLKFNRRPLRFGSTQLTMSDTKTEKGASRTVWHQGFLQYSRVVFDWLKDEGIKPRYIIDRVDGSCFNRRRDALYCRCRYLHREEPPYGSYRNRP